MSTHYKQGSRESIEIIKESLSEEAFKGFLLGNVYKYLNRYEYKGDPQGDLYKAATYIYALIGVLDNPQIANPFQSHILDESAPIGTGWGFCPSCGDDVDRCQCDSAIDDDLTTYEYRVYEDKGIYTIAEIAFDDKGNVLAIEDKKCAPFGPSRDLLKADVEMMMEALFKPFISHET